LADPYRHITRKLRSGRRSIGIEITDDDVKLCEIARYRKKPPIVLHVSSAELPADAVRDGSILDSDAVISVLRGLVQQVPASRKAAVHLVLPSEQLLIRFLKFPDVRMKDLRKLIDYEVKHQMLIPFDNPVYDVVKLNGRVDVTATGSRKQDATIGTMDSQMQLEVASTLEELQPSPGTHECECMLVIAPQAAVVAYTTILTACGLNPLSIETKVFSLYRLLQLTDHMLTDVPVVIVDMNMYTADITIIHESQIKLTRNVALSFAEERERTGSLDQQLPLSAIISEEDLFHQACQGLAHELERVLSFYRYTLNNRHQATYQVIMTGSAARFEAIADNIQRELNIRVEIINLEHMHTAYDISSAMLAEYAVPIGLALRGDQA